VPGWRCGWVIAYNKAGYLDKVVKNLATHQMIQLHINSLVQSALPRIFSDVPDSHFDGLKEKLKASADVAYLRLKDIRGITPIRSQGAMYQMVQFDPTQFKNIADDVDFAKKLLSE
jgi:aspartate/methionine/tyrosine aminotransferase